MSYAALQEKKSELIRKALDGSVFVAPDSVPSLGALTTTGGELLPLPSGWGDLGHLSTDAAAFARATETTKVRSFGSVESTREDVTSDEITMAINAQETKKQVIGLFTGADVAALRATAGSGEVAIAKPDRPKPRYYRVLGLFVDEVEAGEIYFGRYMPRSRITEFGDQNMGEGDDPIQYPMTFTGYKDSAVGFSHRWHWAGPGWLALLASMGFDREPTTP
ncbi:hypothetical protein [Actinoplanes sp. NPDC026623]|uniref:phage tail tube protein n=1 Tax=Actinoplanes sp. NPDC026623 TaxID=3155610 RepID=UPI0033D3DA2B